jgi:small-conductance mechanosensitive channel
MDNSGVPVSFDAVAREARVSRSWLYNQPELRAEIERLRTRHSPHPPAPPVPDRQRASDTSLLRRLDTATERIQVLEKENQQLRETLALALGEQRTATIQASNRDTPKRKSSTITGPCA